MNTLATLAPPNSEAAVSALVRGERLRRDLCEEADAMLREQCPGVSLEPGGPSSDRTYCAVLAMRSSLYTLVNSAVRAVIADSRADQGELTERFRVDARTLLLSVKALRR